MEYSTTGDAPYPHQAGATHDVYRIKASFVFQFAEGGSTTATFSDAPHLPFGLVDSLTVSAVKLPETPDGREPEPLNDAWPTLPKYHVKIYKEGMASQIAHWMPLGYPVDLTDPKVILPIDGLNVNLHRVKDATKHDLKFRYVDGADMLRYVVSVQRALPENVALMVQFTGANATACSHGPVAPFTSLRRIPLLLPFHPDKHAGGTPSRSMYRDSNRKFIMARLESMDAAQQ
jgi:hypothetical protein